MTWEDVSEAIRAGTFETRVDRHLSRSPLVVDEQGWGELNTLLASVLGEAEAIAAKSAKRLAKSDAPGIPTRLVMMHFESAGKG
jgi:hypothetical protein